MTRCTLFHSLQFHDADRAMAFLRAVGFTEAACHRDDSGAVLHAQYDWRDTGGIMFGSVMRAEDTAGTSREAYADDGTPWERVAGHGRCYCVVESDEAVDVVYAAAMTAGAISVRQPQSPDYGGRTCTIRDLEGNEFSFGSYPGE